MIINFIYKKINFENQLDIFNNLKHKEFKFDLNRSKDKINLRYLLETESFLNKILINCINKDKQKNFKLNYKEFINENNIFIKQYNILKEFVDLKIKKIY